MNAYVTRDSVCAGDDGDAPHARVVELEGEVSVASLVRDVVRAAKLPQIAGGRASWCLSSGVPLAVIAQEWSEPRLLSALPPKLAALDVSGQTVKLHATYFAQQDPEVVFEVLRRLRLHAE